MLPSKDTRDNLWTLIAAPTIWAVHFLLSYIVAAYACAPNEEIFRDIAMVRLLIGGLTAIGLLGTGLIFLRAFREWRADGGGLHTERDQDTSGGREAFLEFSTVLLAALSFVAILFVAMPAIFTVDCR